MKNKLPNDNTPLFSQRHKYNVSRFRIVNRSMDLWQRLTYDPNREFESGKFNEDNLEKIEISFNNPNGNWLYDLWKKQK